MVGNVSRTRLGFCTIGAPQTWITVSQCHGATAGRDLGSVPSHLCAPCVSVPLCLCADVPLCRCASVSRGGRGRAPAGLLAGSSINEAVPSSSVMSSRSENNEGTCFT